MADSLKEARQQKADSIAGVRKYRSSKHYKDSVSSARNKKAKALKDSRKSITDSITLARRHVTDSMSDARQARTDSMHRVQKKRTDSLGRVKKYKTSKRYTDSVSIARRHHSDSIKAVQKIYRDSVAAGRKHVLDSTKTARKHVLDSTKVARTKFMDSVKVVRKKRVDSLAKIKADKEKLAKAKEKKKAEDNKLKLEIKIKQKREQWSNKNMLKKRWTPVRKFTQNSFTHYNYYFNANKKMDEALLNMTRTRKENYDSLIGLFPYDPNRDSAMMAADMDSIIHKLSVGIQIHDPRVKWSNDMYLLLGEAYYYKGKYDQASVAFRYIIATDEEAKRKKKGTKGYARPKSKDAPSIVEQEKESRFAFLKHKSVHNDAILWLARTYTSWHQVDNAESILSLLESDSKLPESLKGRLATEKAFIYLTQNNTTEAAVQLTTVIEDDHLPDWLRLRAAFLQGQLLQEMGEHSDAAQSFEESLVYYPKIEMDFYARKNIAFNKLVAGQTPAEAMVPLKKILSDGKYQNFYDQVYFVLGQLAAKANKNDEAITYLTKSTSTPKATKKQKAISFATLGDVYYSMGRYTDAKAAYDSSAKYAPASAKDGALASAQQRSKGLKEMAGPSNIIHDQDSLLKLAELSKKEQQSEVRRYLRYLEKKQRDSIDNAENAGVNAVAGAETDPTAPSDATSWYFANPTLMSQGNSDFKRKWGNRPLVDNWRRAASLGTLAGNSGSSGSGDDGDSDDGKTETGLPTEESLLAKIPNTAKQKEQSLNMIYMAYISLAKAYIRQLEDYGQAVNALDTLDAKYPNHNQKEEALYLRYQIAVKQNKLDKAQAYAKEITTKYPNSEYANLLRPRNSESRQPGLVDGKPVAQYYEETWSLVMGHQYTEALMRISVGKKQFDDPKFKKRFEIAEASALAGMGQYDKADTAINAFIKAYPGDSLMVWATTVRDYIKQVRNGGKPSWYKEGPVVVESEYEEEEEDRKTDLAKEALPPPPPPPNTPALYSYKADSPHYCILVLPGIDGRTGTLKKNIKSLDSSKYSSAGLELLIDMYDMHHAVFIVKGFENDEKSRAYMAEVKNSTALQAFKPGEVEIYVISANNYKKMLADKQTLPYVSFYNSNYK